MSYFAYHVCDNKVDARICKIFVELCNDLNEYRKKLFPMIDHSVEDKARTDNLLLWKKVLDPVEVQANTYMMCLPD